MIARLPSFLATAVLAGALLAGCGGGSKSSSQTTTLDQTFNSTGTTPGSATAPATTSTQLTGAALEQSVASCKAAIQAEKVLPASAKQKLEAVCPNAAKGEAAPVKRAAEEVCAGVINGSAVPAGAAREQALAACRNFLK